jgi:hypothetical protein
MLERHKDKEFTKRVTKNSGNNFSDYNKSDRAKEIAINAGRKVMTKLHKDPKFMKAHAERSSERMKKLWYEGKFDQLLFYSYGNYGWYDSNKAGKIFYRSSLELRLYKLLDLWEDVISYDVEKVRIKYEFNGCYATYIPDIRVWWKGGIIELIEVKPIRKMEDPLNMRKFKVANDFCDNNANYEFTVITDENLDMLESTKVKQ